MKAVSLSNDHEFWPNEHAEDQLKLPYVLEARPSQEFAYGAAITKLVNVIASLPTTSSFDFVAPGDEDIYQDFKKGDEIGFTGSRGKFLQLSACIDTDSRITIGCAGAALTYMGRRKAVGFLPGSTNEPPAFRVSSLEMFRLSDTMYVVESCADTILILLTTTGSSAPIL